MGNSISYISSVITFDDLMLSTLKTVFRIPQNNNVMNFIPNENTKFVFQFSEFEFPEPECFCSILHLLIELFHWSSVKACLTKYLRKECGDLNEVASDNDYDKGVNDANCKDVGLVKIAIGKALTVLNRFAKLKDLAKEEINSLVSMKDKLEKARVLNKKQS